MAKRPTDLNDDPAGYIRVRLAAMEALARTDSSEGYTWLLSELSKREIEIMHLVGASNAFIAWPFLLEGMLFGLFGACLTGCILAGWRYFTINKWQELFPFVHMTADYMQTAQLLTWLALIGMALGAVGSALSVRKHIRLAMAD